MSRSSSPMANYNLQSYKQKLLPKVNFNDVKVAQKTQIQPKIKPKPIPSRPLSQTALKGDNLSQTQQISQDLANSGVFSARASRQQWKREVIAEAGQIRAHMTDDKRNMETTYEVSDFPAERLRLLQISIQQNLERGEFDPLFSHEEGENPIVSIESLVVQQNPPQKILDQKLEDAPVVQLNQKESREILKIQDQVPTSGEPPVDQFGQQQDQILHKATQQQVEQSEDSEMVIAAKQPKPCFPSILAEVQSRIQESDIVDFIDNRGQIEIFEEGRAVSELEIFSLTFDNVLSLLLEKRPESIENAVSTLKNIKNYYVNKITRKGTEFRAMEEATRKLDIRCVQAEKDAMNIKEQMGLAIANNDALTAKLKDSETELEKCQVRIRQLIGDKEQMDIQIATLLRQNNFLAQDLKRSHDDVDDMNQKIKHLNLVSQRLRTVADKANERATTAEKKFAEDARKRQSLEDELLQQVAKSEAAQKQLTDYKRVQDGIMFGKLEQIERLNKKLEKYGESEDKTGIDDVINLNLRALLINIVQVTRNQAAVEAESLETLKIILQNILTLPTVQMIRDSFVSEFKKLVGRNTCEVQTDQSRVSEKPKLYGPNMRQEQQAERGPQYVQRYQQRPELAGQQASQLQLEAVGQPIQVESQLEEIIKFEIGVQTEQAENQQASSVQLPLSGVLNPSPPQNVLQNKMAPYSQKQAVRKKTAQPNGIDKAYNDDVYSESSQVDQSAVSTENQRQNIESQSKIYADGERNQKSVSIVMIDSKSKVKQQSVTSRNTSPQKMYSKSPNAKAFNQSVASDQIQSKSQTSQQKQSQQEKQKQRVEQQVPESESVAQPITQNQLKSVEYVIQLMKKLNVNSALIDQLGKVLYQFFNENKQTYEAFDNQVTGVADIQITNETAMYLQLFEQQSSSKIISIVHNENVDNEEKRQQIEKIVEDFQETAKEELANNTQIYQNTNIYYQTNQESQPKAMHQTNQQRIVSGQQLKCLFDNQTKDRVDNSTQTILVDIPQQLQRESFLESAQALHTSISLQQEQQAQQLKELQEEEEKEKIFLQASCSLSVQVDFTTPSITFLKVKLDELMRRCEMIGIIKDPDQKRFFDNFLESINKFKDVQRGSQHKTTINTYKLKQMKGELLVRDGNFTEINYSDESEKFDISDDDMLPKGNAEKFINIVNITKEIQVGEQMVDFSMVTDPNDFSYMNIENSVYKIYNEVDNMSVKDLVGLDDGKADPTFQQYPMFLNSNQSLNNSKLAGVDQTDIRLVQSKKQKLNQDLSQIIKLNSLGDDVYMQTSLFNKQFQYNDQLQTLQVKTGYGEYESYKSQDVKVSFNDFISYEPQHQMSNSFGERHIKQATLLQKIQNTYGLQNTNMQNVSQLTDKQHYQLSQGTEAKITNELQNKLNSIEARPRSQSHISNLRVNPQNSSEQYHLHVKLPPKIVPPTEIQSNIPTYDDFQLEIKENFEVTKKVMQSYFDQHPRYGDHYRKEFSTQNQVDTEQIAILHNADKIYLRFNPCVVKQNVQPTTYPCIIKNVNIFKELASSGTQIQVNTYNLFQSQINCIQSDGVGVDLQKQKQQNTLLPVMNDKIFFIRVQSMSINKTKIPAILEEIERLTNIDLQIVKVESTFYLKIPYENVQLKSLTWIIRIIRMVLNARMETICSVISENSDITSFITDPNDATKHKFNVVPGTIRRREAESLPYFLLYWAQQKYGNRTLIMTLLWNIIANVTYYQFESDEVYLFARFLFDDLETDFFLMFLELRRILRMNVLNPNVQAQSMDLIINGEQVLVENIPAVVSTLLQNWEPKRQYALIQSIYSTIYQDANAKQVDQIPFTQICQLILCATSSYRKLSFQMAHLVFTHLAKESNTFPHLGEHGFRQLCAILLPHISQQQTNELFFTFSAANDNVDCYNQTKEVTDFRYRKMTFNQFQDMYQSSQMCRFSKVSVDIIEQTASAELKKLIRNSMAIFNIAKGIVQDVSSLLSRAAMLPGGQRFNLLHKKLRCALDVCQCDLVGYDYYGVANNFKQMMIIIIDSLVQIRPEGCIAFVGGAMQSLTHFLKNVYSDTVIE